MTRSKCPCCREPLGNHLYADVCPFCQKELKHNTATLTLRTPKNLNHAKAWPVRLFHQVVRMVES